MRLVDLELRHLRAVVAMADLGSVSKAAAYLGVSQPSLTAQLQRIENTVGGQLFERSTAGVEPTPLGQYVINSARAVLVHMDHLRAGADTMRAASKSVAVRLGGIPGFLLAPFIAGLRELLPNSEITSQIEPSSRVLIHLLDNERVDVALLREFPGFELRFPGGMERRVLIATEPIFVALATGHPLAGRPVVDLADLAEEEWIGEPPDDSGLSEYLRAACEAVGFVPRTRHTTVEANTARGFIVSGQAVSLCHPHSREGEGLVVRPLRGDPLYRRMIMAWRQDGALRGMVDDVCECAVRAYADLTQQRPTYARWQIEHASAP